VITVIRTKARQHLPELLGIATAAAAVLLLTLLGV
jgi:hypothetical protein